MKQGVGAEKFEGLRIAAIVPCYNEEVAVGQVVKDLLAAVDGIVVYVYDNNCSDDTVRVATEAGAVVRSESRKGKGNVVRRAFADIDADVYLLIDGDDTYDASAAPQLIETLLSGPYDHVLGVRTDNPDATAYRPGHASGNRLFNRLITALFGEPVTDMLSGYRVFSHRFVKSFPALAREFEIETELTVHAVNLRVPQIEVPVGFKDRPEGSESKLRTYHD
ncbi:MAG: glycosyltransferase, partial [Allobranchiibius sp.]